jgi:PAS domain S-box-containing protein
MNTLRALRRSEERYRRVIESVQNHAILTLDPEGRIRSCNASIESILGFTVEEVLGKHISFLYLEEDIMEHFADLALQSALDQGKFQYEGWRQRKDGDHVWAHVVISPMFDDQGALEGYTKVLRDMTDRKDMEERLRKSEARFRTIFMGAPAGITLLNLDGSVIVSNPVMHEMLGYSVREFGDQNFLDLIHPDDADRHQRFYDELVVGHRDRYQLETRFLREDGDEIWNNLTVALVRDSNADPMFAISMLEDISESKRIKNELDEVKFRLLESLELDRVHLAQELHDDPIQELYGLLYMINDLRELISTGTETRIVEDFKSGLERVIETLRQICGELRPPSLAPFGLEGAIREYTDEFRKNNPEIAVHLDLEYDGQTMSENVRMALYRIFQQSMANVVRHAQASRVDVRMHLNRDQVRLDITDDGVGFNVPENMVGLARDGHLGLVGASERVDMIHGHLLIQSQPGEGTHISVSAPIRSGRPTELEQES